MLTASVQSFIQQLLSGKTGIKTSLCGFTPVGGGSINHTYHIKAGASSFFCKINKLSAFPGLFAAEQKGLKLLAHQQVIGTPRVIAHGHTGDTQVLILEWIEQGLKTDAFWQTFGKQLAALHYKQHNQCGLDAGNYMGALPQNNEWTSSWTTFFIQQRLQPQVQLALERHLLEPAQATQFEKLYLQLDTIFPDEPAALLHGDLWSGNFLCDDTGKPVLIDPAVYYGHRSMDLAMTTLFGGFDGVFYESYQYHFPLPPNYKQQWEICNLYPLLIHLNLFGKGYLSDILHTIGRY
jgi:protein-ribulosamine 3-kinase